MITLMIVAIVSAVVRDVISYIKKKKVLSSKKYNKNERQKAA